MSPRKKITDHHLHLVGGTWYFRRTFKAADGRTHRESFSLKTGDLATARAARNAHLLKPVAAVLTERAGTTSGTIEAARLEFLADRERSRVRPATLASYTALTKVFAEAFPGDRWQVLTPDELDAALRTRYPHPESHASAARHIGALLKWASAKGRLRNPALATYRFSEPLSEIAVGYLTVEEAGKLIAAASTEARPAIILGLFAGIRPEEVARLDWRAINREERTIRIDAAVSKTRTPRIIEGVPEALWRHLEAFRDNLTGPICPRPKYPIEAARRAAELTRWPHDALRHTFATYYTAHTGNPGPVAHALGHSDLDMLTRHYNGVAKKSEAAAFFAL